MPGKTKLSPLYVAARAAALQAGTTTPDPLGAAVAAAITKDLQVNAPDGKTPALLVPQLSTTPADPAAAPAAPAATPAPAADATKAEMDALKAENTRLAEANATLAASETSLQAQVSVLQAQAGALNDKLLSSGVTLAGKQAELQTLQQGLEPMRAIVAASASQMNIALGHGEMNVKGLSDAQLLAEHVRLAAEFEANFKAGGVAAITTTAEPTDKPNPAKAARIIAARIG